MRFRRHRIIERQLDMRRLQPAVDDRARIAAPTCFGEIGDDRRRGYDLGRLDGEQIRIARTDPDAIEAAKGAHSMSLASALTAAAAMALPPLRPRMTMAGRPLSSKASFDSAAPTKPTGMPRIAAGRGAPRGDQFEEPKESRRRIADSDQGTAEARQPEIDRRRSPRGAELRGKFRRGRIGERTNNVVVRRKSGAGDALGDHARIAENRRAGAKRIPRRLRSAGRKGEVARRLHHAAGMDDPNGDPLLDGRETGKVGLAANDGEGSAIDRRCVLLVRVLRLHDSFSAANIRAPSWRGAAQPQLPTVRAAPANRRLCRQR